MPSNSLNSDQIAGSSSGELASTERLNADLSSAGLQEERLNTNLREELEATFEGLLFLSDLQFDEAIVGIADRIGMSPVVVYDTTKLIDILCERDGMDREEATEFYEFNILGAYVGERTPMFINLLTDLVV
jgi:hypothetical protein